MKAFQTASIPLRHMHLCECTPRKTTKLFLAFVIICSTCFTFATNKAEAVDGSVAERNYDLETVRSKAKQGDPEAQYLLGLAFEKGVVVPQSNYEAAKWYQKSAYGGNAKGQEKMGAICLVGAYGVPQDASQSFSWYLKAAKQGLVTSQVNAARMLWNGEGTIKNYEKAFSWYLKAAEQGHIESQAMVGHAYRDGLGVHVDYSVAAKWFKRAANSGYPSAQFALGMMYSVGKGVPQDDKKAEEWFRKAERAKPNTRWDMSWMLRIQGKIK